MNILKKVLGLCNHDWVVEEKSLLLNSARICRNCGRAEIFRHEGWQEARIVCSECKGQGSILDKNYEIVTCPKCKGTGK